MAGVRTKVQMPVGSSLWIGEERQQIAQFKEQEAEDFAFSARNEVEWLNEHMAEIFSNNQLNVTEIFKTPGKLRGKTPRTARKKGLLETRAPLTDIFSTNTLTTESPTRSILPFEKPEKHQGQQENCLPQFDKVPVRASGGKLNADSGYHGMSEDDMDVDEVLPQPPTIAKQILSPNKAIHGDVSAQHENQIEPSAVELRTTDGSFHLARENLTEKLSQEELSKMDVDTSEERQTKIPEATNQSETMESTLHSPHQPDIARFGEDKESLLGDDHDIDSSHSPSEGSSPVKPLVRKSSLTFASLPAREPLTTKKSIGARVSRTSHLDQAKTNPAGRGSYLGRYTTGKSLGGTRQPETGNEVEAQDGIDVDKPGLVRQESDQDGKIAKLHNKSSTQRLHDRINLLGQTQTIRPTKSIPAAATLSLQPVYPELSKSSLEEVNTDQREVAPSTVPSTATQTTLEDEDDWIQPPSKQVERSNRPQLAKSRSVDVMEHISGKDSIGGDEFGNILSQKDSERQASPLRLMAAVDQPTANVNESKIASSRIRASPTRSLPQADIGPKKAISVYTSGESNGQSTTPAEMPPSSFHTDGPLSASKSKLQSIMKSARGLFTSSAGISAQAKLETLSPSSMKLRSQGQATLNEDVSNDRPGPSTLSRMAYPDLSNGLRSQGGDKITLADDGRRTRSSTEKNRQTEERTNNGKAETAFEAESSESKYQRGEPVEITNARIPIEHIIGTTATQNLMKPTRQSPRRLQKIGDKEVSAKASEFGVSTAEHNDNPQAMAPPPSRLQSQTSQIQKPKDLRRPIKPAKEAAPKPKPQPVAIRVGTLSQRIPLTNSALSSTLQDSLPSQTKEAAAVKKASNVSSQTSTSSSTFKSSISATSKPKALIAAERKKEQDEREAQRKLEHKREMERKRAAQQEEAHKREQQQRQEVERQRERDRIAAADESRKLAQKQANEKKRLDQNKKEQQRDTQRVANDLAHAIQNERTQPQPAYRSDLGAARQVSKFAVTQELPRVPSNYAPNPAKPPKRVFEPDNEDEPARPVRMQGGQTFQQNESKRRRTEDEETFNAPTRPTMPPPVRQSNARKENPKTSIFSSNYSTASGPSNHHAGPSLLKTTTTNQVYQQYQHHNQPNRSGHPMDMAKYTNGKIPFAEAPNPPPASHKTPLTKQGMAGPSRSSPLFPNGDNIQLDEIPTDSDEEDSEDEKTKKKKNLPDWALTPNLNEKLMEQERLNTDALFGPIAPLVMEEIFKDKNRHHRFRSRTSSANWFGQDRLTEEDIRNDNAAREKMRREGGWTFGL